MTSCEPRCGRSTDYSLDGAGHLLALHSKTSTDATISKFEYEYDVVGNRTEMVLNDSDTTSYQYDDTYQLTKVAYPGGAVHDFAYDASGNRTDWDISAGLSYDYYYDSPDQLTNTTVNGTTWSYYYDGNGAMTTATDGTVQWDYYYNYDGRLYGVNKNTSSVLTNAYNPDGTRRTLSNGETINFGYDGQNVLAEYDSNWNSPDLTYTHGPGIDEPLVMTLWNHAQEPIQKTEYYLHHDALGSTRDITDSNQNTVTTYSYDTWGKTTEVTISGNVSCPFRYTSREWDDAAEAYYLRARYYNQHLGRFVSRDPWVGNSDKNPYVYVSNCPIGLIDSTGLFDKSRRFLDFWPDDAWEAVKAAATNLENLSRAGDNPCKRAIKDYGQDKQFDKWTDDIKFRYDPAPTVFHGDSPCDNYYKIGEMPLAKFDEENREIWICDDVWRHDGIYEKYFKNNPAGFFQGVIAHEYSHMEFDTGDKYTLAWSGVKRGDCPYALTLKDCRAAHTDGYFFQFACLDGVTFDCLYDLNGNNCLPEHLDECLRWDIYDSECMPFCGWYYAPEGGCSPYWFNRCECYECCQLPGKMCKYYPSRLPGWGGYQGGLPGTADPRVCKQECCFNPSNEPRPPTCPVPPWGSTCRGYYIPGTWYCGITGSKFAGTGYRECVYNICEGGAHLYYYDSRCSPIVDQYGWTTPLEAQAEGLLW